MKRAAMGILLLGSLLIPGEVSAGKVDDVKKVVREKCGKEIPPELLMSAAVRAYNCEPDQDVTILNCKIKCLNNQDGNVVGK